MDSIPSNSPESENEALEIEFQRREQAFLTKQNRYTLSLPADLGKYALVNLAELIPDCIFVKDFRGSFRWVNQSILEALGAKDSSEVLGKTDFDFFSKEHSRLARLDELRVMETGEPIFNKLENDQYADGRPRWVLVTRLPLRNAAGEIIGTYGMAKDITEIKTTQDAYQQADTFLSALLENIPDAIYFKDRQSRFQRVSKASHLEGLSRLEDCIGKTDADFFTEEHARQAFADEQRIIQTGIPVIDKVEKETFPNKPDGWVSSTKVPLRDSEGNITGLVGISRDVTERFKIEEALRKAKDELELRVQERTAALVQEIKEHLKTEKALRDGEQKLQEANTRLHTRVEQLNFLNAISHRLAQLTQRRDLLPAIVDAFSRCYEGQESAFFETEGEGVFLRERSPGILAEDSNHLCALARSLWPKHEGMELLFPAKDQRSAAVWAEGGFRFETCLVVPLVVEERVKALVLIFGRAGFSQWYRHEGMLMQTLAAQVSVSLSNANNFQSLERRARVEGELAVAQGIQKRFTPQSVPNLEGIILKGAYQPAYEVGGDYLDYFRNDHGRLTLIIADVAGKGIPAALVMTMLRSTVRAEAKGQITARELLCAVNDLMIPDLDAMTFITASCLILDREEGEMTYARAGHPPLLVQHAGSKDRPKILKPRGMALGILEGKEFSDQMEEVTLKLNPGDSYLLYTDGLVEAMDSEHRPYGMERLLQLLERDRNMNPSELVDDILIDVRRYIKEQPFNDDLTLLAVQVAS